ncbi:MULTISPECIES: site-specific integrase [Marinobacter]|uniref:Phage integrase, N-terminal SAM-like domain n=1 Tax=Marinobacter segnicrescens TaxID=430453 RepID=A0A1I0EL93_9GAMM|nr:MULTISPECIES: site-specific integrase [Marinobacter]UZD65494.1 phage integrase N-terminal SAM-like domain-containing protein [Marinobacter sp. AN1]SET45981.1 Phage integrase, N-terminal SAM-like domain [Marinobacter segnicrescens]
MHLTEALEQSEPGLFQRVQDAIRHQQLNQRTQQTYLHWIARFVLFHQPKTPETLESADQQLFLLYLQDRIQVSRARLNQARQALMFFYSDVLHKQESAAEPA